MSAAYTASAWDGFGTAVATAAAALAGLLFIAISINLKDMLEMPGIPSRAGQTLLLFGTALIAAVLVVVPGQARVALGLELVATGLILGGAQVYIDLTTERSDQETFGRRMLGRVFPAYISCGCLVVGGATLAAGAGGGLYWLVPGVIAAIAFGLLNVWVLLVEIMR